MNYKLFKYQLLSFGVLISVASNAQVGINTTSISPGTILDIKSDNKGIILPRLNINNLNTITPVTEGTTSGILAYNTNTTTGPGYFYWDGAKWISISDLNLAKDDLKQLDLLRTYDINGKKLNFKDGNVGIDQNNPARKLHVGGTGKTIRVDGLSADNNEFNLGGTENASVMVNAEGDLVLQEPISKLYINESDSDTFLHDASILQSNIGEPKSMVIHTRTVALNRETLLEVVFYAGCAVTDRSGSPINDGITRGYDIKVEAVKEVTNERIDVAYDASSYTSSDLTSVFASFALNGSGYVLLPAGTHTIEMTASAEGGGTFGYTVAFGVEDANRFQVIYHD
ncbi:hypothetical protein SCB49_08443 [unidentified eubacterium SCB49]|nr:hypothetical protein SCB49_08443 [unidentified eubacterium SCB49]